MGSQAHPLDMIGGLAKKNKKKGISCGNLVMMLDYHASCKLIMLTVLSAYGRELYRKKIKIDDPSAPRHRRLVPRSISKSSIQEGSNHLDCSTAFEC